MYIIRLYKIRVNINNIVNFCYVNYFYCLYLMIYRNYKIYKHIQIISAYYILYFYIYTKKSLYLLYKEENIYVSMYVCM